MNRSTFRNAWLLPRARLPATVALAQFVYLVLFSYTFFFEQYTGLAVTILCTVTLFIVMQVTGRMNWETVFKEQGSGARGQGSGPVS
ncbi:MAG: hypothetical protein ACR2L2_06030 [Acidobacteriota bacterium]